MESSARTKRRMKASGSISLDDLLSAREYEVAQVLLSGASYEAAASLLHVSRSTVHSHAKSILRKTGLHSRRELIARFGCHEAAPVICAPALTKREREVASYLLRGNSRKETARCLGLSAETVKAYCRTLYEKLDIASRDELFAVFATAVLLPR